MQLRSSGPRAHGMTLWRSSLHSNFPHMMKILKHRISPVSTGIPLKKQVEGVKCLVATVEEKAPAVALI